MEYPSQEMAQEHINYIFGLDKKIDKLVTLQEITTDNINKLTLDIKETLCPKNDCDVMHDRLRKIEGKTEDIEICKRKIEDMSSKVNDMWFFTFAGRNPKLVLLMLLGLYVIAISDVRHFLLKLI